MVLAADDTLDSLERSTQFAAVVEAEDNTLVVSLVCPRLDDNWQGSEKQFLEFLDAPLAEVEVNSVALAAHVLDALPVSDWKLPKEP